MKAIRKSKDIRKILVITLSNIGDVILTLPVLDHLKQDFPGAALSVMVGPKAAPLLKDNPAFAEVIVYQKRCSLAERLKVLARLRRTGFDLTVDLRHTGIPLFLPGRKTSLVRRRCRGQHMRGQHLNRLKEVHAFSGTAPKTSLFISPEDRVWAGEQFIHYPGPAPKGFAVIAPGAADRGKRWAPECFARVCEDLALNKGMGLVFVGDRNDQGIVRRIRALMEPRVRLLDVSGETSLKQLAAVMARADLALVNDSAPMHLASYLDVPVCAVFGQSDPETYGPWGEKAVFVRNNTGCPACRQKRKDIAHHCLEAVTPEDVISAINRLLSGDGHG